MNRSGRLEFLATVTLGLFAGGMLFIALCLLPFWASLAPENYREAFQLMGPIVGAKMVPLMIGSILLAGVCALVSGASRFRWTLAFLCVAAIVPLYAAVHAPVNAILLGTNPLPSLEISGLRSQWFTWHWVRTGLGLAAFGFAAFRRVV